MHVDLSEGFYIMLTCSGSRIIFIPCTSISFEIIFALCSKGLYGCASPFFVPYTSVIPVVGWPFGWLVSWLGWAGVGWLGGAGWAGWFGWVG